MALSFQDQLASTCQHFVEIYSMPRSRNGITAGVEYYFRDSKHNHIKAAEAVPCNADDIRYIADYAFIQKYSALFDLSRVFQWKKPNKFKSWLTNILSARPKFIHPFYRSTNNLFIPRNLHQQIGK
ncbi:hypothetical protein RHGRI_023908 [Rhododendron griersonianum]|uniref:Uncharacterized protein n=1 Tax=Rhododendron griersonianum TaxID=479676 RepID=A0AAV6JCJ5_9ERIC|nr:hypothetical protein RHGRI_023908 [Rhododendron griersonianum]